MVLIVLSGKAKKQSEVSSRETWLLRRIPLKMAGTLSSLKVCSFRKEPRRTHLADHRDRCG